MSPRSLLAACLVATVSLPTALAAPATHIDLTYVAQPTAPTCVPAAVAMALGAQGVALFVLELARAVPVHPDGVAMLDVQEALRSRGARAWLWRGTDSALHALLAAGAPPIVLTASAGKHALVVHGWDPERGVWLVRDPALPTLTTMTEAALRSAWEATGRQLLVVGQEGLPERALPPEQARALRAEDARYRALEWMRRAREHAAPNAQALALYEKALDADGTIPELHNDAGIAACRSGRAEEAISHLRAALALRPGYETAAANLERILNGVVPCGAPAPTR